MDVLGTLHRPTDGADAFDQSVLVVSLELSEIGGLALTTGATKRLYQILSAFNGWVLAEVMAAAVGAPSGGPVTLSVDNLSTGLSMLSTPITIEAGEYSSTDAAVPPVINAANAAVATGARLAIGCSAANGATGVSATLRFRRP